MCTIRSTPSQPIHCIVWAKSYLFTQLFGIDEEDVPEVDHTADESNAEEIANLKREAAALKEIKAAVGQEGFAQKVFEKVFDEDVVRLLGMEDMWRSREKPVPLRLGDVDVEGLEGVGADDQKVWDLRENIAVFRDRYELAFPVLWIRKFFGWGVDCSLNRLSVRWKAIQKPDSVQVLTFDKDDVDTLDFVASTANIRSTIFSIPAKSKFDIKRTKPSFHMVGSFVEMAGNIIPAIATTNAIVAGLCVLQARHVLAHDLTKAKMVFLSKRADQAFVTEPLRPPNPYCQVCGIVRAELRVAPDTTLETVVEDLRGRLGYGEEFSLLGEGGRLLYDVDFEDLLGRSCVEVGVVEGRTVTVVDEDDETNRVNLELLVSEGLEYEFPSVPDIPQRPPKKEELKKEVVENGVLGKRGRDGDDDLEFRKRARVAVENDGEHEIIVIEDDDIIMLD